MPPDHERVQAGRLIRLIGPKRWRARVAEIRRGCTAGYGGRALAQAHAIELMLDRIHQSEPQRTRMEQALAGLAGDLADIARGLSSEGRERLQTRLCQAITGPGTLVGLLHLARCARLQRERGFDISFDGLERGATYDMLLSRDGAEAELACETVSAENGRDVHRGAWFTLMDRIDPDLQAWLATHPGRYLLKMTLPQGLKRDGSGAATLHERITRLLSESRRADHDEAAVLRLEPLLLAGAQASELGLLKGLRQEFGPEAHLAVTSGGNGVFVMAARAGREDEVAEAVQRRMAEVAPVRLTGTRPGILAMFIEDTDRLEWRALRDQLRLEGATRQFLTRAVARSVVAVTCVSRLELLGGSPPDAAEGGELRYRNPGHPQSRMPALAPAVLSTM